MEFPAEHNRLLVKSFKQVEDSDMRGVSGLHFLSILIKVNISEPANPDFSITYNESPIRVSMKNPENEMLILS
jgi:hypothetical protein